MVQHSHPYLTTGKIIVLILWTLVGKLTSLLFNTLSRFFIAFLPRSKHLLKSCLQSPSAVILEPKKIESHCFHYFPLYEVVGSDDIVFVFGMPSFKQVLSHSSLTLIERGFSPLHFLPFKSYHLHIWGWYFSWQSWFQLVTPPAWHVTWCILHRG